MMKLQTRRNAVAFFIIAMLFLYIAQGWAAFVAFVAELRFHELTVAIENDEILNNKGRDNG